MEFFDADVVIGRLIDQEEEAAPTAADLIAEMDRTGVARSLVTSHKIALSTPDWGNDDLAAQIAGKPRLRGVFGTWIMVDRGNPPMDEAVDALIRRGAAGVQLWPTMCGFDFAPWQCPDLFAALADRRLPLFMHADQCNASALDAVLRAFPRLIVVAQRVIYGDALRYLALMRTHPGLHLCTSPGFVGGGAIEQFDRYVGCDRILFGSGLFKYDQPPAVAQVAYAQLPDHKKSLIASGNIDRLLAQVR